MAIKDPTAAVFLRQNGSNLLMVGHREEAALGVLAACFVSLAARQPVRLRDQGSGVRGEGVQAANQRIGNQQSTVV